MGTTMALRHWEYYVANGNPVVGANVAVKEAALTHPNAGANIATTTTNADGMWEFTGLDDTKDFDVVVTVGSISWWYKGLNQSSGVLHPAQFGSQSQNRFLGSPDGSSGRPSFRALVNADLPSAISGKSITVNDNVFIIQDQGDNTKKAQFELSGLSTGGTRIFTLPDANVTLVGRNEAATLQNKTHDNSNIVTLRDDRFTLQDDSDNTKQLRFQLSGIGTGQTRVLTVPNFDGTIATLAGSEAFTNKSIALGSNTVSGTTAQFNSALSDNDFATLAGTENLSNKTALGLTVSTSPLIASAVAIREAAGTDLTSANDVAITFNGNHFIMSAGGVTTVNRLTAGPQAGYHMTIRFTGSITVKHNGAAAGGGLQPILLSGSVDFAAIANSTLALVYDASGFWLECGRKA